jgi:hypothetical protein
MTHITCRIVAIVAALALVFPATALAYPGEGPTTAKPEVGVIAKKPSARTCARYESLAEEAFENGQQELTENGLTPTFDAYGDDWRYYTAKADACWKQRGDRGNYTGTSDGSEGGPSL